MNNANPCNFQLVEIISDAVDAGLIEVGSNEHRVALRVAQDGLKSLADEDRLIFELVALPALIKPPLQH